MISKKQENSNNLSDENSKIEGNKKRELTQEELESYIDYIDPIELGQNAIFSLGSDNSLFLDAVSKIQKTLNKKRNK